MSTTERINVAVHNYKLRQRRVRDQKALLRKYKAGDIKQPDLCEICRNSGKLCVDHNHATDLFRGWLCAGCNSMLAFAKDNIKTLIAGATFLMEKA